MPLPWVFVFFLIFSCFFSFTLYFSSFYKVKDFPSLKLIKLSFCSLPW